LEYGEGLARTDRSLIENEALQTLRRPDGDRLFAYHQEL
jgi:hypothetical protein